MKKLFTSKYKYLFPAVHFLLSFLYERSILIFTLDRDVVLTIPRNQVVSDLGERILGYGIAKLISAMLIFWLWSVVFAVLKSWKERKNLWVFTGIFLLGTIGILFLWPQPFSASADNLITYSYARRFWPEYWHGAYTSCIYTAILMVLPLPVFLTIFQWLFGVFTLGYLYNRITDSPVLQGKGRNLVFLTFLMPGAYTLFTNSYRTEPYALLCMFLTAMTAMDFVDRKKRPMPQFLGIMVLCSFVGVWRTEGIILGVLLFLALLLFLYDFKPGKSILLFGCMLACFVLISVPQKLGDQKYYGKDYSFINSFPTLKNILSSENAALSYEGAQADLAALEAVTPVEILRTYGMDGYRRYNYANGRGDINQSLATDEAGKAYMSAYYRIVLHNLPIYAKTQMWMLMKALMVVPNEYVVTSTVPVVNDIEPWTLQSWTIGEEDFAAQPFYGWKDNTLRSNVASVILKLIGVTESLLTRIKFYTLVLILIPLFEIFLFFREAVGLLRSRKLKDPGLQMGLASLAFILLGQAAAILLVMPAGTLVYLHAFYYSSFILSIVYMGILRSAKHS